MSKIIRLLKQLSKVAPLSKREVEKAKRKFMEKVKNEADN